MILLIVLYPFLEIYAFYKFIEAYSFLDALFLVVLSAFLGNLIIRMQGKATLGMLQRDLLQGKNPTQKILHRSLVILGGFLLFLPGIISDVLGVLCILPGSRHVIAWYLKSAIARGVFRGKVFMSGFGSKYGAKFGAKFGTTTPPFESEGLSRERDAQVIDIQPSEITHSKK